MKVSKKFGLRDVMPVILIVLIGLVLGAGVIPLHELGHVIAAKSLGGEIREVCWFAPWGVALPGEATRSVAGYLVLWGVPEEVNWLVDLSGGFFQGLLYLILGAVFFKIFKRKLFSFNAIPASSLIMMASWGVTGVIYGLCEAFGVV